jgi:DNA-binding transcriptional LysR family regulator
MELSHSEVTMELMQLEMFVAMVEGQLPQSRRSRVHTQPALTMAIRKLEQELGAPLFDRSNRNDYVLTDSGEVLYEHAKRLLNLRDGSRCARTATNLSEWPYSHWRK